MKKELDDAQRGFLHRLAAMVGEVEWEEQALQVAVYDAARATPLPQPKAFQGLYRTLLDRDSGPRAGGILSVLEKGFVLERITALPYSEAKLLAQTAIDDEAFGKWISKSRKKLASLTAQASDLSKLSAEEKESLPNRYLDFHLELSNGRQQSQRLALARDEEAGQAVARLSSELDVEIGFSG